MYNEQEKGMEKPQQPKKTKGKPCTPPNDEQQFDQGDLVGTLKRGNQNKKSPYTSFVESGAVSSTEGYIEG